MKILMLVNHYLTIRIFRRELIQELAKNNEVVISIPEGEKEYMDELRSFGARLVYDENMDRRKIDVLSDFKVISGYKKLLKAEKPDRVITYTIKCNIYGAMACRSLNIPCYSNITGLGSAYYNGGALKFITSFLYKVAMKNAKVVFFENKGNEKTLLDKKIFKPEQTYVLNGAGVNLEKFTFSEYPQKQAPISFLFFARIMKEKGVDELFYAIEKLSGEYDNLEFKFIGIYEDEYEEKVNELESRGLIHYYGFQKDVIPFIQQCSCVVLPSYHEGMANTLLESAAIGRPIITSNIHGCKEAVIDFESGFLANVCDEEDLYQKMKMFIELPYEKKADMGRVARKHMEKNFDKYDIVKETMDIVLG
jgi:galacturonosyltransferase